MNWNVRAKSLKIQSRKYVVMAYSSYQIIRFIFCNSDLKIIEVKLIHLRYYYCHSRICMNIITHNNFVVHAAIYIIISTLKFIFQLI